jgi:hypothetical protein
MVYVPALLDRLPDARQRERRRGHRPGGLLASAPERRVVIRSDKAFLTTVTTRLAIDHLRSARVQRETYYGPWLPEPLLTSPEPNGAAKGRTGSHSLFPSG